MENIFDKLRQDQTDNREITYACSAQSGEQYKSEQLRHTCQRKRIMG